VLDHGVTVEAPAEWFETPFHGELGSVVFPLVFLGTKAFSGPCASGPSQAACSANGWFPSDWTTPSNGVVVLWLETEFPDGDLSQLPGQPTVIDGRPAKVWSGKATSACPAGAATETDAYIPPDAKAPGVRVDMTACVGASASASDRADVQTMLESLRISS
jgi:hypothetical protein